MQEGGPGSEARCPDYCGRGARQQGGWPGAWAQHKDRAAGAGQQQRQQPTTATGASGSTDWRRSPLGPLEGVPVVALRADGVGVGAC